MSAADCPVSVAATVAEMSTIDPTIAVPTTG